MTHVPFSLSTLLYQYKREVELTAAETQRLTGIKKGLKRGEPESSTHTVICISLQWLCHMCTCVHASTCLLIINYTCIILQTWSEPKMPETYSHGHWLLLKKRMLISTPALKRVTCTMHMFLGPSFMRAHTHTHTHTHMHTHTHTRTCTHTHTHTQCKHLEAHSPVPGRGECSTRKGEQRTGV